MATDEFNLKLPLIVNLNLVDREGNENIDINKIIIEIDSTVFPNKEQLIKVLYHHLIQSSKEVSIKNLINTVKSVDNFDEDAEHELGENAPDREFCTLRNFLAPETTIFRSK